MRRQPKWTTLRALFARSSNRCAVPACQQELVTDDNLFVGQVCHIGAAEEGGRRFDPRQTDEQRRSPENLILLCYPHHVRIEAPTSTFSTEQLLDMKRAHEQNAVSPFQPAENLLRRLGSELEAYWQRVAATNAQLQRNGIPAAQFDRSASPLELLAHLETLVQTLRSVHCKTGPESAIHTLDVESYLAPNTYIHIGLYSAQLRVRLLEAELKDNPGVETVAQLAEAQKVLEDLVASAVLND
jgi:hypothetical protein